MKKFAAAFVLFVYLTVSTGFVVSVHWCMNKVDSIALGDAHTDECGKCGMTTADADGCCKNDVKVVKMTTDQKAHAVSLPDFSLVLLLPPVFFNAERSLLYKLQPGYPLPHGPPLSGQDAYLHNRVFRI